MVFSGKGLPRARVSQWRRAAIVVALGEEAHKNVYFVFVSANKALNIFESEGPRYGVPRYSR